MTKTGAIWKWLNEFSSALPEAYEDHPWGDRVVKVLVPVDAPNLPAEILCEWIAESYGLVAPKTLARSLASAVTKRAAVPRGRAR